VSARAAFIALALALAACGPHRLDLVITIDAASCTLNVPAGGSVLYQVEANGSGLSGGGSFCGGCLPVDNAISGPDAMVASLRTAAPACACA
jgi:hypothetical protein